MDTLSGVTTIKIVLFPFCKGVNSKGKTLLPLGANSFLLDLTPFRRGFKHWVHKCSGLKHLTKDPDYRCTQCQGTACPLDCRPQKEVQVRPDKLEVVASFCYLGDMLSAAGRLKEEVQGAATSSLLTPPLFQNTWLCV